MVKLKDIAEQTGFSITTVSRVMNNSADAIGISKKTQAHVRKVANELKYSPNLEARNLRLGRRPQAVLFLSLFESTTYQEGFLSHPFFGELIQSIQVEVANDDSYLAYMAIDGTKPENVEPLLDDTVSAVISWGFIPNKLKKILESKRIPVVAIEPYTNSDVIRSIYVDNHMAVEQAVNHLYELGHRSISLAYLDFDNGDSNLAFSERCSAFLQIMEQPGHEVNGRVEHIARTADTTDIEAGCMLGKRILTQENRPTAILAVNDLCAMGVIKAAKQCGLSVPKDLSVVGIDDIEWATHYDPPLTTVRISRQDIAKRATSIVKKLFKNHRYEAKEVRIATNLIVRESTSNYNK